MKNLSPEELVIWCQRTLPDDTSGFETIVSQYKNKVYAIAYRLMGNREEAEDQSQEVFLKVYRSIKRLSEPATFESWLRRITVNTCLDAIDKRKRRPFIEIYIDDAKAKGGFDVSSKSNASDSLENKEIMTCLKKALAELDDKGRSAIVLRDVEEMSYEEIADSLEVGLSAVKMRIHRARLALQKLIEKICPGSWRAGSVQ